MKPQAKKRSIKKIALALSLCALIVWGILGTGASLAWFTDTSNDLKNIFHVGEFQLEVSHRLTDGVWEEVDSLTKVFDEEALYEPGYVQVVYLKVENKGTLPFDFHISLNVNGYTLAVNKYNDLFNLKDYLLCGIVTTNSEEEMKNAVPDREAAQKIAVYELPDSDMATNPRRLEAGSTAYVTLVVRMPEEVDNIANYRGDIQPKVELGLIVTANQVKE